jgi:hypothetical protein
MGISIKVTAFGLGAVLAAGGLLLLLAGYNVSPQNAGEINGGWALIGIAVVMWIIGVVIRESR